MFRWRRKATSSLSRSPDAHDGRGRGGEEGKGCADEYEESSRQQQEPQQEEAQLRQEEEQPQRRGGRRRRFKGTMGKARTLLLSPFNRRANPSSCPSSSSSYPFYYGDQNVGGCYLCFLPTLNSSDLVQPPLGVAGGNPGSMKPSSYWFVKRLIERNDFYAPECHVHKDF